MASPFINITYRMVCIYIYFYSLMNQRWQIVLRSSLFTLEFTLDDVHSMALDNLFCHLDWGFWLYFWLQITIAYWLDDWFSAFYIHVNTHLYDILLWGVPRIIHHSHWTSGSSSAYSPAQKHIDRKVIIIRKNMI